MTIQVDSTGAMSPITQEASRSLDSILHEKPTRPRTRRTRLILLSTLLVLALMALGWVLAGVGDTSFMVDDFVEYWAAGRLNLTGGDPYSAEQLMDLQLSVGWDEAAPLMMWNPPPTLTLVMPFGLLDYATARVIWLGINLLLVFIAADVLWRLYGGPTRYRLPALVLALSFMPTLLTLRMGQISIFVLAGLVGFLPAARRGRWWAAGALLPLIAVKPHIAYLFWAMLAVWWLRERNWRLVGGALVAGGIAWLIPTLINPQVNQQYLTATTTAPPLYWLTMTWGTLLRLWLGGAKDWLAFVPVIVGLAWFGRFAWRTRVQAFAWEEQLPWLLLLSTMTMAFGWPYDLVVLLPALLQMTVWLVQHGSRRLQWLALGAFILFELGAYSLLQSGAPAYAYIWMPPVLLIAYWWLRRHVERNGGAAEGAAV